MSSFSTNVGRDRTPQLSAGAGEKGEGITELCHTMIITQLFPCVRKLTPSNNTKEALVEGRFTFACRSHVLLQDRFVQCQLMTVRLKIVYRGYFHD